MDYSKQGPPPYSQTNEPGQPYPQGPYPAGPQPAPYQTGAYGQPVQTGYGQQPTPNQTGAYGQPVQTGYGQTVVVTQPMTMGGPIGAPAPPDYMIPSILVCLFCFCPTGIFAIYYANRRTNMLQQGDIPEAQRSADCARNLMIASILLGICWIIAVIVIRVVLWSTWYSTYRY